MATERALLREARRLVAAVESLSVALLVIEKRKEMEAKTGEPVTFADALRYAEAIYEAVAFGRRPKTRIDTDKEDSDG